jgi:hypothetical protein
MIGLQLRINNSKLMANVQCIRLEPVGEVKDNDICTYEARVFNQPMGTIKHPYNDVFGLGKAMIDFYSTLSEEDIREARAKSMLKNIKENYE